MPTEPVFEQKTMQAVAEAALQRNLGEAPVIELRLDGNLYVGEYYTHRCKQNSIPGILVLRCFLVSDLPAAPHLYLGAVVNSNNTWQIPNGKGVEWLESTDAPSLESLLQRGICPTQN